jgi:RNA polymerase sigma-70 factor (ECF subfamily)
MTVLSIGENRRSPADAGRAGAARRDGSARVAPGSRLMMTAGEDDKAAFARIVLPHLTDAYSLARWITGNRADAEDVVQEASLRAFRAICNVDANPRAWLLTVVRNTAFTWLRKNRPAGQVVVEELEEVADAQSVADAIDADTPEAALIAKTESAWLEAAIASLPTVFREVLVLRDIHGLCYREIAEVTGVPIGTVMSRLARGRGRLADLLARRAA